MNTTTDATFTKPIYGSDHAKLNIKLPPDSMWMNMGYWKDTEDFPSACGGLLEEVLRTAKILRDEVSELSQSTLSIFDLGFGCGDQCIYFRHVLNDQRAGDKGTRWGQRLGAYVGITLDSHQFSIAKDRVEVDKQLQIFRGDAGMPKSWTPELQEAVMAASQLDPTGGHENWLLALDTLYHFQPSKWPVIEYAKRDLDASFMAYDLCVADNLSVWHRVVLRLMAFLGHSPFVNWVTIEGYRERLEAAGYARDNIEIRDISEHVFRPLARFIRTREVELRKYGMSIGRFSHGAAMFDWWGRTGVVRGCVIVARK